MSEEQVIYTPADPQWHERRRSRMGASELGAMLGIDPYKTAWELQQLKLGKIEPGGGTKATSHGHDYENALLDIAERELGPLQRQVRVTHPFIPLAATCDGLVCNQFGTAEPVEAKTTGLVGPVYGHWGEAGSDEIPEAYLVQVHAQLMCTGADLAYLYALIAGRGTVRFEIERSDTVAEMLGNAISDWWERHIVQGIEVEQSEPPRLEVVKRLRKTPNKVVELDPNMDWIIDRWRQAKESESAHKKEAEQYQALILAALGDAEAGTLPDGRQVTYFESKRKGYAVEPTTFRQLRIKLDV